MILTHILIFSFRYAPIRFFFLPDTNTDFNKQLLTYCNADTKMYHLQSIQYHLA